MTALDEPGAGARPRDGDPNGVAGPGAWAIMQGAILYCVSVSARVLFAILLHMIVIMTPTAARAQTESDLRTVILQMIERDNPLLVSELTSASFKLACALGPYAFGQPELIKRLPPQQVDKIVGSLNVGPRTEHLIFIADEIVIIPFYREKFMFLDQSGFICFDRRTDVIPYTKNGRTVQ